MKVAALTTSYIRWEGDTAAGFIHNLTSELVKAGVDISVVTPMLSPESKKHEVIDGVDIHRFHYFRPTNLEGLAGGYGMPENMKRSFLLRHQLPFLFLALFLHGIRVARKCDVIHTFWIPSGFVGLLIKKLMGKPVAFSPLGSGLRQMSIKRLTSFLNEVDVIFTGSGRFEKTYFPPGFEGNFNVRQAMTIINIDSDAVFPIPDEIASQRAMGRKIVYWVARMVPEKNPRTLIKAIPQILERRTDIHFIISGEGPLYEECKRLAAEMGIQNSITFTGHLKNSRVHEYLRHSDLITTTSLMENCFSTTILEGFHLGKPFILSNVGSTGKYFYHGKFAYLYEAGNERKLASAILSVIGDEELLRSLGSNTREFLEYHSFTKEQTISSVMKTYQNIRTVAMK